MTPVKLFPQLIEWIFGEDNGIQAYLSMAKFLGRYVMPEEYLHI